MAASIASSLPIRVPSAPATRVTHDPAWARWTLIAVALSFLGCFLFLPLLAVFAEALRGGVLTYLASFRDPDAMSAIRLTLLTAAIAVPANLVFGVAAAWAIAKFRFRGKSLLTTLIDLPFAVSPVIAGLRAGSAPGSSTTTSRSSSQCPGSCWRPSLSPFRSLPAN